jgi:hypothetical protein
LARLNLFGYQTDLINACTLRNIDHIDDAVEQQGGIPLDEHRSIVPSLEDLGEAIPQILLCNRLLIDLQGFSVIDGDNNGPI